MMHPEQQQQQQHQQELEKNEEETSGKELKEFFEINSGTKSVQEEGEK